MKLNRPSILMALVVLLFARRSRSANDPHESGSATRQRTKHYGGWQGQARYAAGRQPRSVRRRQPAEVGDRHQRQGHYPRHHATRWQSGDLRTTPAPVWASDTYNLNARGGYFEIDLATWSGAIRRSDGAVAKVLFGRRRRSPVRQPPPRAPSSVQLNMPNATVAQPTTGQTVQITQGPTTTISGAPSNPSVSGNIQTTPAQPIATVQSGSAPTVAIPGVKCIDFGLTGKCGYEKTDQLGTYSLNLKCTRGFTIRSGAAPAGNVRTTTDRAAAPALPTMFRTPTRAGEFRRRRPVGLPGSRTRPSPGSARAAPSGTAVGACYKCPDELPRRTATSVFAPTRARRRSMRPSPRSS